MLVSLILANLVFLGGAWKLLNTIAATLLLRQGPQVDFCKGCQEAVYQDSRTESIEMGNIGRSIAAEETTSELAPVEQDSVLLLPK